MNNNDLKFEKKSIFEIEKNLYDMNKNQNNISNRNNIIYKNNLYDIKKIDRNQSIEIEIDLMKKRLEKDKIEKFNLINFKMNMIKEIEKYQKRLKYLKEYYRKGNPLKYNEEDIEKNLWKTRVQIPD